MDQYLKAKQLIGTTLFWSPLDQYSSLEKSLRIEAELLRRINEYEASELYYAHPGHSPESLTAYFKDKQSL